MYSVLEYISMFKYFDVLDIVSCIILLYKLSTGIRLYLFCIALPYRY